MRELFVGEAIKPAISTCNTSLMAAGEPGLPREFMWRGKAIEVAASLLTWRESGKCRNGSPELYVRKHWFEVVTTSGSTMKLYFERQPRRGQKDARWWLFSIIESEATEAVMDALHTRRAPEPAP